MKILIGCEESQAVAIAFRELGFEAYSCDLLPSSGGHPEWHLNMDIFNAIRGGTLQTEAGTVVFIDKWVMAVFFPPCTDLAVSGSRHFAKKIADGSQQKSIQFFMSIVNCGIPRIVIENPIGIMGKRYRKPNQIIQPWQFGDKAQKSTCLGIEGLPNLAPTNIVEKGEFFEFVSKKGLNKRMPMWYFQALKDAKSPKERRTLRSKTFAGIAKAMASQWGSYLDEQEIYGSLRVTN